jgi:hypothetical protein
MSRDSLKPNYELLPLNYAVLHSLKLVEGRSWWQLARTHSYCEVIPVNVATMRSSNTQSVLLNCITSTLSCVHLHGTITGIGTFYKDTSLKQLTVPLEVRRWRPTLSPTTSCRSCNDRTQLHLNILCAVCKLLCTRIARFWLPRVFNCSKVTSKPFHVVYSQR